MITHLRPASKNTIPAGGGKWYSPNDSVETVYSNNYTKTWTWGYALYNGQPFYTESPYSGNNLNSYDTWDLYCSN